MSNEGGRKEETDSEHGRRGERERERKKRINEGEGKKKGDEDERCFPFIPEGMFVE